MHSQYYKNLSNDIDEKVLEWDLTNFHNDDDLDADWYYRAVVEIGDMRHRIQLYEDTSPRTTTVSNYEAKITEKEPLKIDDDSYTKWRNPEEKEFKKRSEKVFPKTLTSFIEDELGIIFDEDQERLNT